MLNISQQKALKSIQTFLVNNKEDYFCLNAPSGYGKTYLTDDLKANHVSFIKRLQILGYDLPTTHIDTTATTNKAATQLDSALTIHKLIGLRPLYNGKLSDRYARTIRNTILIIDEASYVSKELFDLIELWTENCKIIFIGDMYQLKAVGCKFSVFEQGYPSATLDIPQRQDPNSGLFALCCHLRQCVIDQVLPNWALFKGLSDVIFPDDTAYVAEVTRAFLNEEDVRLLAYHNNTVDAYNDAILQIQGRASMYEIGNTLVSRKYVKDTLYSEQEIVVDSLCNVSQGNRAMVLINGKYHTPLGDWYKQELGRLKYANAWKEHRTLLEGYCEFSMGNSLTTYKSQGSTYDSTIVDVRDIMLCRGLDSLLRQLYVGVSRARHKVHIFL